MAVDADFHDGLDQFRSALAWWGNWTPREDEWPTSSITGGGAIRCLERELGERLGGLALALPSGSAALWTGLRILGAGRESAVSLPTARWFGDVALISAAGARVAQLGERAEISMISPDDSAPSVMGARVVVDAANAVPSSYCRLREMPWSALALSFGPGKPIDAGEGGALIVRESDLFLSALRLTQHPVRQRLTGLTGAHCEALQERINPMAALVALHHLCAPVNTAESLGLPLFSKLEGGDENEFL